MRILVTGASGFVGPYLSKRLAEEDAEILGLGLSSSACIDGSYIQCDLLNFPLLERIITDFQPDRVFHLAGLVHPIESQDQPRDYYQVNVQGAVNLIEAIRSNQPKARLLVVSSSEVYGGGLESSNLKETDSPRPLNHYATSKLQSEQVALQYHKHNGLRIIIARPFNHSGPGQSNRFVISDFCRQIADVEFRTPVRPKTTAKIEVGNLQAEKDFLDVRDVVDAYAKLLERGVDGEIYNICSGKGTSIQRILDLAIKHARINIKAEISKAKFRTLHFPRQVGDNTKLRETIDWQPSYDIETTIIDTLNYWRENIPALI